MSNGSEKDTTEKPIKEKPIMAKDATLRDYFAGQALLSNGRNNLNNGHVYLAETYYSIADAMLEARKWEYGNEQGGVNEY